MPTYKNPFVHGNLFLILTIEFPDSLTPDNQSAIRKLLPAPLHKSSWKEDEVEVHKVTDVDPVASYNSNKVTLVGCTVVSIRQSRDRCLTEVSFALFVTPLLLFR